MLSYGRLCATRNSVKGGFFLEICSEEFSFMGNRGMEGGGMAVPGLAGRVLGENAARPALGQPR